MLRRYFLRLTKWAKYAFGKSYQHVQQPVGRFFDPLQISGYFNDLSEKARWNGKFDAAGVPIVVTDTSSGFHFPIQIFQWGLGNWEVFLADGERSEAKRCFLVAAEWALRSQHPNGGWPCWTGLRRPVSSVYSAMAQGQGISLLLRAEKLTGDDRYFQAAKAACPLMFDEAVGLLTYHRGCKLFEEYPGGTIKGVLNGAIFGLFGVHELALRSGDPEIERLDSEMVMHLEQLLPEFDAKFWSRYDLSGNLAAPFYHRLHSEQLLALAQIYSAHSESFAAYANRFREYSKVRVNVMRAVLIKVAQKLRQADIGEMK